MSEHVADTLAGRLKTLQEQHAQAVTQYNGLMRAAEEVKGRIIEIKGAQREVNDILKELGQRETPHLKPVEKE